MVKKRKPNKAELLLGQNIEALRMSRQVTRRQLGRKINKLEQQVEKYEKGEFVPLPIIEAIYAALDAPIQKRTIRRISFLRKLEIETKIEQEELCELYNELNEVD